MKGKIIFFFTILLFLVSIVPTLVSFIRDVIEVYGFNISALPDSYFIDTFLDINTYHKFFTMVDPPNVLGWAAFGYFFLNSFFSLFGFLKVHESYVQKDTYGSHGTSRLLTNKEIKDIYYRDKVGWFLGSVKPNMKYKLGMDAVYHPLNGHLNSQVSVIGSPGSNKTTGFVLPNIFHIPWAFRNESVKPDMIITDPKSELFTLTANYLESMGYEVHVLDFIHLQYGDQFNPLDFITDDKELMEIAEGYVNSVGTAKGGRIDGTEAFWCDQEAQVLAALIGLVKQTRRKELQTFTEVNRILTSKNVSSIEDAKDFFYTEGVKGAPLQLWKNFLMIADSEKTRANILGGLSTKLKLFAIEGIRNLTYKSTLDIKKIGAKKDKPIALFIFMPDKDRTFAPIINVTVTTILNQLYKTAYLYGNKLYAPVYLIFEEIANIGRLPGLLEMLGTMRGRRIYPMLIWQSLTQMKDRYKDGWEDIMAMCDTHIYLGINDEFTAKYCSSTLGTTTIKTQGLSRRAEGIFGVNTQSENLSYHSRHLLFPDECMRLDNKKLIMRQRACYPSIFYKVQYRYWKDNERLCVPFDVFNLKRFESIDLGGNIQTDNVFTITDTKTVSYSVDKNETDKNNIKESKIQQSDRIPDFNTIEPDLSVLFEESPASNDVEFFDFDR